MVTDLIEGWEFFGIYDSIFIRIVCINSINNWINKIDKSQERKKGNDTIIS